MCVIILWLHRHWLQNRTSDFLEIPFLEVKFRWWTIVWYSGDINRWVLLLLFSNYRQHTIICKDLYLTHVIDMYTIYRYFNSFWFLTASGIGGVRLLIILWRTPTSWVFCPLRILFFFYSIYIIHLNSRFVSWRGVIRGCPLSPIVARIQDDSQYINIIVNLSSQITKVNLYFVYDHYWYADEMRELDIILNVGIIAHEYFH